ncbi:MAG TPA: DUF2207 domain-containing protein [Nostocaceae cyanobacterium]|nr:DUF2207 domain-containing protein [Nostocaceae cyanobacterium]
MNKRLIQRILFLSVSLFVAFLIIISHVIAQEVPFYWDSINVNIDVQTNGDMLVTEQQTYVFDANYTNQRYRYILLDKVDEIKEVTVQENNQIIPSETGIKNNQFWIRWQHKLKPPAKHTFVLKYRAVGGFEIDEPNTHVYWKAIFPNRQAPIKKAKVRVQLPEALSGKVSSFKSFGVPAISREINKKTFEFVVTDSIPPQQELQIQVTFPSEILNLPQPESQNSQSGIDAGTLVYYAIAAVISIPVIANSILSRRCPECKKLKLKRTHQILVAATSTSQGKRLVVHHCENCSYHYEYEEVIPVISDSGGGGGGGGCGSGGGCGGGGCGGGGCGGGG